MSFEFWEEHKDELYDMYYNKGMSTTEIGRYFGCWGSTISSNMKRIGFKLRKVEPGSRINAKYHINSSYFDEINTAEKAYVLGFICADGHVSKQNSLMFAQNVREVDVLEKINAELESNCPILVKDIDKRTLTIHDEKIAMRLKEMGINNNKSMWFDFHKVLSYVPKEYERDFIRGMFDGDGSICIYHYDYFKKPTYHFGFTGIYDTAIYIRDYFNLGTKMADEGNGIFTCVSTCTANIIAAGHMMYDDATIYLNRKKEKFEEVYMLNS